MLKLIAETQPSWYIMVTIVGGAVSITLTVVSFYLKGIKDSLGDINKRADKQDEKIAALTALQSNVKTEMAKCKNDCDRNFVSAEQFVRSESYTRDLLKDQTKQITELAGSLKIVEQLPNLIGSIVRQIMETQNKEPKR